MSCMKEDLLAKIESCEIVCGIVWWVLGYVGLPLAVEKAKAGFKTIGFDVQPEKVAMVNEGRNYIGDVVDQRSRAPGSTKEPCRPLRTSRSSQRPTSSPSAFLRLSTNTSSPTSATWRRPTKAVAAHLRKGSMVVLESTTYPGTTEELIKPLLERGIGPCVREGLLPGLLSRARGSRQSGVQDEEHAQGGGRHRRGRHRSHCGPCTRQCWMGGVTRVSSPAVAEMEKILENTYRNVNIGLVKRACDAVHRHGHGHLGSGGCRQDEALRLHGVLPGPWPRRALNPPRSVLSFVEKRASTVSTRP